MIATAWKLQDAKNRFSEVVEHALHDGPQTITRRGKETAVLVSVDSFRALSAGSGDLVRFFQGSPLHDTELDLDRPRDYGREVSI
jgi:antitoxin Phd